MNVSHREFSTGFFYGNGPIEDINKPTMQGYLRDYLFLGTIKEEVKPGIYAVDIKNQIRSGAPLEYIGPDVLSLPDTPTILDENFQSIDHLDHCRTGYLQTTLSLKPGYMIRREIQPEATQEAKA